MTDCSPFASPLEMNIPAIEDLLLVHPSTFRRGQVPLHMIYQPHKPCVQYFHMPECWCIVLFYDVDLQSYTCPNVYTGLLAKSEKYRKGKVSVNDVLATPHQYYQPWDVFQKFMDYEDFQKRAKRWSSFKSRQINLVA